MIEINDPINDLLTRQAESLLDDLATVDQQFIYEQGHILTPAEIKEGVKDGRIWAATARKLDLDRTQYMEKVLRAVTTELVAKTALRSLIGDYAEDLLDEKAAASETGLRDYLAEIFIGENA